VNDDPFDHSRQFGIDDEHVFIPFNTTGTVVHFESRVPTEWEKTHLPVILLTGKDWNPTEEVLQPNVMSREETEMRNIKSLSIRQVNCVTGLGAKTGVERYGEVEAQLGQISNVFDEQGFCNELISAVNIAMTYRDDIDRQEDKRKAHSLISNERHSRVTPEEVSRKWNVGLQTAKDTLRVTTQKGIRTAIHPLTRRVRVDHLHLH
jgi:hypothetical protein